ncbi:MAG: GTPase HflX [Bdellovibrionaceae bacterium]|nr:GTPase HflX [Pseudobdellovibrionaceae bacterium]
MSDKAIVVGVGLKADSYMELKESLAELEDLVYAAGGEVVGTTAQVLEKFNPSTLIGKGKTLEINELATHTEANLVVIDHHLSGVQSRNLEQEIGVRVLDRNQLILDIFSQRAQTYEGKLQVELALMLDQLPRMVGAWQGSLSRLGGGIGTRGPGESALEMDRRRIHNRVKQIKKKLEIVKKNRQQYRQKRQRNEVPQFALIGYTNSGKSTLLNRLTQSDVFVKDQVFATLDPTTRKVHLPEISEAVITDTVGFIRNLPPQLIEAFKATLEESAYADILVVVVDISSNQMQKHLEVIDHLIKEFEWSEKPIIYVFNKVDKSTIEQQVKVDRKPRVFSSALTGEGIDRLRRIMAESVKNLHKEVELFFPKQEEYRIYELGRDSKIVRTEVSSKGTICYVNLTPGQMGKWSHFLTK